MKRKKSINESRIAKLQKRTHIIELPEELIAHVVGYLRIDETLGFRLVSRDMCDVVSRNISQILQDTTIWKVTTKLMIYTREYSMFVDLNVEEKKRFVRTRKPLTTIVHLPREFGNCISGGKFGMPSEHKMSNMIIPFYEHANTTEQHLAWENTILWKNTPKSFVDRIHNTLPSYTRYRIATSSFLGDSDLGQVFTSVRYLNMKFEHGVLSL